MRKHVRRLAVALAAGGLVPTGAAPMAAAAPPQGACPPSFTEATYAEMAETFPEVPELLGEEAALAILVRIDVNANGEVCWIAHPSVSRVYERDTFVATLIDDVAAPH